MCGIFVYNKDIISVMSVFNSTVIRTFHPPPPIWNLKKKAVHQFVWISMAILSEFVGQSYSRYNKNKMGAGEISRQCRREHFLIIGQNTIVLIHLPPKYKDWKGV